MRTRRTSLQKNAQWRNDKKYQCDTCTWYSDGLKEAIKVFADIRDGKVLSTKTHQEYLDKIKQRYNLDGTGSVGTGLSVDSRKKRFSA